MRKYLKLILFIVVLLMFGKDLFADVLVYSKYDGNNWQIFTQEVESKKEKQLTFTKIDKRMPQCSAHGDKILYRTANSELILFDTKENSEKQILSDLGIIMDHKWGESEDSVVVSRMRTDLPDDSDVWLTDVNGKNRIRLTKEIGLQYDAVLSRDGDGIVYVSQSKESNSHNLVYLELDSKKSRKITNGKYYDVLPSLEKVGKKIAFSSNRKGNFDIWTVNVSGKDLTRLTDYEGLDTSPAMSFDG